MDVDDALSDARARLLHDLVATLFDQAPCVDVLDDALRERRIWVEHWPAGAPFVSCLVAQDVKEGMAEVAGRWPRCFANDAHELHVDPDLGDDPHWVCEECATVVARIGELSRPGAV